MKAVELTLLLTLLLPSTLFAGYLDAWHKRDTNYFSGICFGNGLFVAVGEQGKILTSRDGQSWMPQSSGVSNDLTSVTYGKPGFGPGKFVALGNRSWVLTSSDGTNWARQMFISAQLNEVSYSSDWDLFVAVATQFYTNDPNAFISFDGTNWDEQKFFADTCPPGPSYLIGLRAITFGNDTFVAVGDTCTPIFTYNIAEWVDRGSKQEYFRGVAFGNGAFVAVGAAGSSLPIHEWDKLDNEFGEHQ
jgi:hypothetical protein